MGDLITSPANGVLSYVPKSEFDRVLSLELEEAAKVSLLASLSRINALYMISKAGSGHIGSSFSCLEVATWLKVAEMDAEDIFYSSKGHDAPGHYALTSGLGELDFELIHQLRRAGGLPGHPDVSLPVCPTNTGSLGMGISKAKGMLFGKKLLGKEGRVFVMTGDGELQEGQIWESLVSAANHKLDKLFVVVDHNKLQSDTFVSKTSDLGDLEAKFTSFGWAVARCDGNDPKAIASAFAELKVIEGKPKILIADTIKGCGVSFMEHTSLDSDVAMYTFHSGAPQLEVYLKALKELEDNVNAQLTSAGAEVLALLQTKANQAKPATARPPEKLIEAYSKALIECAEDKKEVVALDADLVLDTGLIPFRERFPDRFLECGIAEQDMVSQAGGMALQGLLPVVHSFACFLSTRPNEQIYNNATEHTRIIYAGSLAGLLPGGPGHSHQAVRDIASLSGIPGLELIQPCCSAEVAQAVKYAVYQSEKSTYIRLASIPCEIPWTLPEDYKLKAGRGTLLREGKEVMIISYGPVMLGEAWKAAEKLTAEGIQAGVLNLPWLNRVDADWLAVQLKDVDLAVFVDDHYREGGQGEFMMSRLHEAGHKTPDMLHLAVDGVPSCGTHEEVLNAHGLSAEKISQRITETLKNNI
jgi:transketolase